MTRDEALSLLKNSGVADPSTDVRRLWDHAISVARSRIADDSDLDNECSDLVKQVFERAVEFRSQRMPVSQIIGGRDFWKAWFHITPDVLDPRPETESLVERALDESFSRVLDLGTGSGCILISLLMERPEATGVGTDISEKAVLVAGRNAALHNVADRLILPLSDWFDDVGGRFDLIVSNPPYIAVHEMDELQPEVRDFEPRIALTDEADGLTAYHRIAAGARDHLTPGGRVLVEIGYNQADAVRRIFCAAGLEYIEVNKDLSGKDRVVTARSPLA